MDAHAHQTVTKDQLLTGAAEWLGGEIEQLPLDRLHHLITRALYTTDILLNEIERRGALTFTEDGGPMVPYSSDHMVHTILTRPRD